MSSNPPRAGVFCVISDFFFMPIGLNRSFQSFMEGILIANLIYECRIFRDLSSNINTRSIQHGGLTLGVSVLDLNIS